MPYFNFTVDSALLQELGERLVGKPYIALAELIKNSFDADALKATIDFDLDQDKITVKDTGQGMTLEEFKNFWMRIGSTHKKGRVSHKYGRQMTGSKGVGRLAVQYLAKAMTLRTVSEYNRHQELTAHIEWEQAIKSGELTEVKVEYNLSDTLDELPQGTEIILEGLKHQWPPEDVRDLARQIWSLQPPFRSQFREDDPDAPRNKDNLKNIFNIEFLSNNKQLQDTFNKQISAVLDLYDARIVGENKEGKITISLQFCREEAKIYYLNIPKCKLKGGDWEIRVFNWYGKQPYGIIVQDAREYFAKYGGVHVYDVGFHLPYYGEPKNDWLRIEVTHSHRLSLSELLPRELQIEGGMMFMPTLTRLYGVVNVSTSNEPDLQLLVTRDRFRESEALENLVTMVRYGLDLYAIETKKRADREKEIEMKIEIPKLTKVDDVLEKHRPDIPTKVYKELREDLREVAVNIEGEAEKQARNVSLLGPLATAGMSVLAFQHEIRRQFQDAEELVKQIDEIKAKNPELEQNLKKLRKDLSAWIIRVKATNDLFSYFSDSDTVRARNRFSALRVLEEVKGQVKTLARGIPIDILVDDSLLLPSASIVEWSAIFQNVFTNAFNSMIDSEKKLIRVTSKINNRDREILIQDTGCGVNLEESEELFEPFERRLVISPERRSLGYGGMGLGLTIVRMVAGNIGCTVSFVKPEPEFSTAFSIRWREKE
ncbi:ATP-binding protein [Candidatus Bathyarchaeota archaeon]|nr:ATP-binding protein [Candidatus Bathyarchaeota archaeon]